MVMIHIKPHELPPKHVLKRCTRDARDILPPEYLRYQKDHGPLKYSSRRHNTLYLLALDVVKLGDNNVEAHALAMEKIELAADLAGSGIRNKQHFGRAESEHTISQGSDLFPAPCKKQPAGRPTTSRDKAPYEQPSKRSRFCSICRIQGHKSTTCPARGGVPKAPKKSPRCSKCGLTGHRKNQCSNPSKV
uniref:Uncharacterized protein n=1 Tax=Aegilops tauschii TaxID=37682 RepID=M8C403_AEGTA